MYNNNNNPFPTIIIIYYLVIFLALGGGGGGLLPPTSSITQHGTCGGGDVCGGTSTTTTIFVTAAFCDPSLMIRSSFLLSNRIMTNNHHHHRPNFFSSSSSSSSSPMMMDSIEQEEEESIDPIRSPQQFGNNPVEEETNHHHHNNNQRMSKTNNNNKKLNITLLLIDHYDSFTYNLYDMLAQCTIQPPIVMAKDAYDTWPTTTTIDGIILSPGPGTPYQQSNFSKQAITCNPNIPILGVCLGHQLLATTYGATVHTSPTPIHGQVHIVHQQQEQEQQYNGTHNSNNGSTITTGTTTTSTTGTSSSSSNGSSSSSSSLLFQNLPPSWKAMRYHSLCIQPESILPETNLKVIATTLEEKKKKMKKMELSQPEDDEDNDIHNKKTNQESKQQQQQHKHEDKHNHNVIIQGIVHTKYPHYGVQFHPESVGTEYGKQLLNNFCQICYNHKVQRQQQDVNERKDDDQVIPTTTTTTNVPRISTDKSSILMMEEDEEEDDDNNNPKVIPSSSSSSSEASLSSIRFEVLIYKVPSLKSIPTSSSSSSTSSLSSSSFSNIPTVTPEQVFETFYANESYAIWLDSSRSVTPSNDVVVPNAKQKGFGGKRNKAVAADKEHPTTSSSSPTTGGSLGTISILAAPTATTITERMDHNDDEKLGRRPRPRQWVEYHVSSKHKLKNVDDDDDKDKDILTWLQKQLGQPTQNVQIINDLNMMEEEEMRSVMMSSSSSSTTSSSNTVVWEHDFVSKDDIDDDESSSNGSSSEEDNNNRILPFDYRGGFLGYLGYSVRHDTERYLQEEEHAMASSSTSSSPPPPGSSASAAPVTTSSYKARTDDDEKDNRSSTPSAAFFLAEHSMVYHHPTQEWYLVGLVDRSEEDNDDKLKKCNNGRSRVLEWMKQTCHRMNILYQKIHHPINNGVTTEKGNDILKNGSESKNEYNLKTSAKLPFTPNRSEDIYKQNIIECQEQIRLGESYELCLTNQLEATMKYSTFQSRGGAFGMYKVLRKRNPAPYSAFFNWNSAARNVMPNGQQRLAPPNERRKIDSPQSLSSLAICCSSPERFISVQKRRCHPPRKEQSLQNEEDVVILQAEAKPIKGTIARIMPQKGQKQRSIQEEEIDTQMAQQLQNSIKDRAENYMIVDLLRNDMSRVCEIGSVHVAKLMAIESYTTVHQMVSTIRGTLSTLLVVEDEEKAQNNTIGTTTTSSCSKSNDKTSIDLLKACFPGGSMTGAPKVRTMELLEELEEHVDRGPYSGSLGYVSVNGCMDMNIIIRSAVISPIQTDIDDNGKTSMRKDEAFVDDDGNDKLEQQQQPDYKISVGAGGAITALSNCDDEYDEMMLKSRAVVQAVQEWASSDPNEEQSKISVNEKEEEGEKIPSQTASTL